METFIRRATIKDLDQIRFLFRDTVTTVNSKDYGPDEISVWANSFNNVEQWNQSIADQYFLVAVKNDLITGFASVTADGYLDYLYVHKDYQRQGIAKNLLSKIEKYAAKLSLTEISSHVSKTALSFFEANGFIKAGELRKKVQNIEFVNSIMVKTAK